MKLAQHPEYLDYQRDLRIFQQMQLAANEWQRDQRTITVNQPRMQWSYPQAQEFIQSISSLFLEYNHILWNQFPYCDHCRGQCCGVHASGVHPFDLFALVMLDRSIPHFTSQVQATDRECIYFTHSRCGWPVEWKTVKCWLFYCLGCGNWELNEPVVRHYNKISQELEQLFHARLPEALHNYEIHSGVRFAEHLIDPLYFANILCQAVQQILLGPFMSAFFPDKPFSDLHDRDEMISDTLISSGGLHAFIAEIAEEIEHLSTSSLATSEHEIDQILEDLETLEMIALGQPGNEKRLLAEMDARYSHAADCKETPITRHMRKQIHLLLSS